MKTVQNFRDLILNKTGIENDYEFPKLSSRHLELWLKLNNIGSQKCTVPWEETDNIDDHAFLTDQEWQELEMEFNTLIMESGINLH